MALTSVNYNQEILPQPDMESTYVNGVVASGNDVSEGMTVKLSGATDKYSIATDDLQAYNLGVALEDIDASSGDVTGRIMTGGGYSLASLDVSSVSITAAGVTASGIAIAVGGLLKNNGIRLVSTSDAIKKVVE